MLAEARREANPQPVVVRDPPESKPSEPRTEDASPPESARRSVGDIFKSLIGGNGQPGAFEYPELRGQSPDAAAGQLAGLKVAEAATVRVRVQGKSTQDGAMIQDVGTGTIVHSASGKALILTCAHVFLNIADDAVVEVEVFEGGKAIRFPATLVGGDHDADLAILRVQTSRIFPCVRLTCLAPESSKGQALVSFGCNDGANPTRLDTKLVDINRYDGPSNLVCSTDPKSGRSGGGLFNANGELMGVCSCADRKRSEGLYMAHGAVIRLVNSLELQSELLTAPIGGEDAAEAFAEIGNDDFAAVNSEPASKKTAQVPEERIVSPHTPPFDESPAESPEKQKMAALVSLQDSDLSDAPPFVPGEGRPRNVVPVTSTVVSGPEVTILIDDKTPGAERRVIVIPQASAWMMELLTGETADGMPSRAARSRTTAADGTAEGISTKPAAQRKRPENFVTQTL